MSAGRGMLDDARAGGPVKKSCGHSSGLLAREVDVPRGWAPDCPQGRRLAHVLSTHRPPSPQSPDRGFAIEWCLMNLGSVDNVITCSRGSFFSRHHRNFSSQLDAPIGRHFFFRGLHNCPSRQSTARVIAAKPSISAFATTPHLSSTPCIRRRFFSSGLRASRQLLSRTPFVEFWGS